MRTLQASGFCSEFGNDDESCLTALVHTFEQALAVAITLPANSRDALLARLNRVRNISHNLGYGVGESMHFILAEYTQRSGRPPLRR